MDRALGRFFRRHNIPLYKLGRLFRSSKESAWSSKKSVRCPPEILIMIALLADSATLVRLALCCCWLSEEISSWSEHWRKQHHQDFQFDKDDRELKWLQYFVEQIRLLDPSAPLRNGKVSHHHVVKRARKKKAMTQIEVNWFHAYCCRRQTEFNLSRDTPSKRVISLPSEYHQKGDWVLEAANPRHQVYRSYDHRSLITFRPDTSFRQTKDVSKSGHRRTTEDINSGDSGRFCQLDWNKEEKMWRSVYADGDVILASGYDETYSIWPNGRHQSLKVQWPSNSDTDICTPCEWFVKEVRQGWILAYSYGTNYQRLIRLFNIQHARWCGGVVTADKCHFQMTTQDIVQVFCCSREEVDDQQYSYQLWEYRTDKPNERCLKSETIISNIGWIGYWIDRLDDKQSVVVLNDYDYGSIDDNTNLSLYRINTNLSFPLSWRKEMSGKVWDVKFILSREEMVVTIKNSPILYVLNLSNGTILRQFNLSFESWSIYPLLGSLCYYGNHSDYCLIDTQTGRDYFPWNMGIDFNYDSSKHEMLYAETYTKNHQLTLLDWH